jgi:hypothetical protein
MTTNASSTNKKTSIVQFQTVITGLEEDYAGKNFPLGGKVFKTTDLVSVFQAAIDAINAGDADKITWQSSVAKQKAAVTAAKVLFSALRAYVAVVNGRQSEEYKTLGFAPAPTKPTPATRVAAIKKGAATREALGTRGKQQRKALKAKLAAAPAPASNGVSAVSAGSGGSAGSNGTTH